MKVIQPARWIFLIFALVFSSQADTPPKTTPPDGTGAFHWDDEVKNDYQRGVAFAEGEGVQQDYAVAVQYYRKAALKGYAPAQYDLAYSYEKGLGLECDLKQAAAWYRKAADQGDAEAQNNLGALYATGRGVRRDDRQAVRWYALAAARNDPEATSNLGVMYLQGRAVKRDLPKALELIKKAAGQGYAVAQNNLALMYANGQGVPRDYVLAYTWFVIASDQISGCEQLRDRVAQEMTADDIARARELASRTRFEIAKTKEKESK